ncbi:hypothetical protein ACIRVF_05035 [Kitasatospora sp. NPDC101157]|uniref:hypothetical protein n=1 Tax=Kitasatospora sp. NPDC101157 TaxID=3364098 RepID=UPI00380102B8
MTYWTDGSGIGLMSVSMQPFRALVVLGVVALVRHPGGRSTPRSPSAPVHPVAPPQLTSAQRLLAERLARGEIDPDEYRTRLDTLRGGNPPASG